MVDDRLTDGRRLAELLASELDGLGGRLADVAVTDADHEATPTPDGAFAYRVSRGDSVLAEVFIQPDRSRLEFSVGQDVAVDAATAEGLRVRPKAVRPPRTLVFVEDGAEVKRAVSVVEAVVETLQTRTGRDVDSDLSEDDKTAEESEPNRDPD